MISEFARRKLDEAKEYEQERKEFWARQKQIIAEKRKRKSEVAK